MPKAPGSGGDPVIEHLERHMQELMGQALKREASGYRRTWAPRVDAYETNQEFVVLVDLAGVGANDVRIEVDEDHVTIAGTRGVPPVRGGREGGVHALQLEIPYGPFERRLRLPARVDPEQSSASFDAGLLTVRFPKVPRRRSRVKVQPS